ncbi:unnamed protein product [Lepeophtheirus salmonis]|uniref:(salmon louse) hypothetical protein n=1 Tax=Lepeophtheirus salmonis TaxID=72036 RepID=A0A817F9L4_LEPSM|nr:unnamed protein product [Lepeophtheirus salmonis]CAG9475205.1 unnamed protein product [Lepeophtheirus salmonis]
MEEMSFGVPFAYYSFFINESIPMVPWSINLEFGTQKNCFLMLLKKNWDQSTQRQKHNAKRALIAEIGSQRGDSENIEDNSHIADENMDFLLYHPQKKVYVEEIEEVLEPIAYYSLFWNEVL